MEKFSRSIIEKAFNEIKEIETSGRQVSLQLLTSLCHELCRAIEHSRYLNECLGYLSSEGWDYTSCPEDYEPCDVIFGQDMSAGMDNPNDRDNNIFEVQFIEEGGESHFTDRNPGHLVTVTFANLSL